MLITTELQNNSGKARCERNELQYALRDRHKKKNSRLTNLSYALELIKAPEFGFAKLI